MPAPSYPVLGAMQITGPQNSWEVRQENREKYPLAEGTADQIQRIPAPGRPYLAVSGASDLITSSSSISKINVSLGPMLLPAPRLP